MKIDGNLSAFKSFQSANGNRKYSSNGNGHAQTHPTIDPFEADQIGDDHSFTSIETPMRPDAFLLSDENKIASIESHFEQIMQTLGLDLNDDSLRGTPHRVAKMFVKEIFSRP